MRFKWFFVAFLIVAAAALAACGGAPATPTSTPAPTATPGPTDTPTPLPEPAFGPVSFGLGVVNDESVVVTDTVFPEGIYKIYASFNYTNMPADVQWRREWFYNGEIIDAISKAEAWPHDKHGTTWLSTFNDDGLSAGKWELKLYINDKLAQTGSFDVSERLPDDPVFKPITFARGSTADFEPIEPAITFTSGITTVHGIFNTEKLTPGMTFKRVWYLDGTQVLDGTETVDTQPKDVYDASIFKQDGALNEGTYTLAITFKDKIVQGGSFTVTK